MPLQTAMQQFAGTGSAGLNRGIPGAMTPPPAPRNPAAEAQLAWNQKFGPFTPTQVGQQREAGQPVGQAPTLGTGQDGAAPVQNPEGPAGAVPAESRTPGGPGMAGGAGANAEAAFPGFFKGTPEPGISKREQGIGKRPGSDVTGQIGGAPGPGAKGRLAQALGSPTEPAAAGTPLTTAPPPQVPGAVDPAANAVLATSQAKPAAVSATPSAPAAATATTQQSPAMTTQEIHRAPDAMVDNGTSDAQGTTRGWHGNTYTLNPGAKWPKDFVNLTPKQQQAWIDANAKPASQLQYDANAALGNYRNKDFPLPTTDPNGEAPVVVKLGMNPLELDQAVGGDKSLLNYVNAALRMQSLLTQSPQESGFQGGGAAWDAYKAEKTQQYRALQEALAKYGIYFSDNAPPPPGQQDGGVGTVFDGETPPPPEGPSGPGPTPIDQPPPTQGGGGGVGQGGPFEKPPSEYPHDGLQGSPQYGGYLDISTSQESPTKIFNEFIKQGLSPERAATQTELVIAFQQQQNRDNNRQQQIDFTNSGLESWMQSPFYTGIQNKSLELLNQGDPTDWEGIKNRTASDAAKDVAATRDTLSTAGARRGLSPGAITGIGTRAATDSRMGLSRALGELDVQQAQSGRDYAERGLASALAGMGATSNEYLRNVFNLGSIIGGTPMDYQNSAAGYGSSMINLAALQAQKDAVAKQGEIGLSDAIGLIGSLGGAFLGGPAAAALLGGSALAGGAKK